MNIFSRFFSAKPAHTDTSESRPEQDALRLIDEGHSFEEYGLTEEAMKCYLAAIQLAPDLARAHLNYGNALLAKGDLKGALDAFSNAIKHDPDYAGAYFNLGNALLGSGQVDKALGYYRRALEIRPDYAEVHCCLGIVQNELGQLDSAVVSYQRALEINPNLAEAHINLGNVLQGKANFEGAVASYRRALEIVPDQAVTHNNLGLALDKLGQFDEAMASFGQALEIQPDFAGAHINLANALLKLERFSEAETHLQLALRIQPDSSETLNKLAALLIGRGDPVEVLGLVMRSLKVEDKTETRMIFVNCAKRIRLDQLDTDFRDNLIRALTEPWCRPKTLGKSCAHHIKLNPDIRPCVERAVKAWPQRLLAQDLFTSGALIAVATDPLLCTLLCSIPVNDIGLERFLTMVRRIMLINASASEVVEDNIMAFYCALARQCFINEYVYACTDDESGQAQALLCSLVAALEIEAPVPALMLVTVAAYFPLHSIPLATRLLDRTWPDAVVSLLVQQIREPEEERQYRTTMPRLTSIENEVSVLVRNQYEENPYPRWIKTEPASELVTVDELLRQQFPYASFKPLGKHSDLDILIAGCGTGQQPIGTVQQLQGARILAIDLSLSSLCYAKRKTQELGLTTIEYAQADLLKLGSLERRFDIIESGGVLHHLEDPWTGWRVLLSLLRPGGLMKLGFYSEVARRDIVQLRSIIAEQGYGSTANDIRQCRQMLVDLDKSSDFQTTLEAPDFFSTSACRDLLFHVQEHRMTLTGIDAFLRENNLAFLGFEIEQDVLSAYNRRFPDDRTATDLGRWQIFENENPYTFVGMYQFWIQKAG